MESYVVSMIDEEKYIRAYGINSTNMVNSASNIHNCLPTAAAALGRTLSAAGIMGAMLKGDKDKISIQFKGDGPAGTVLAVANSQGEVKGYIDNPMVDLPLNSMGKLDVGGAIGKQGKLTIIKDLGLREPYIGQVDLSTGEIGDDLSAYFTYSEQVPSAVALGVLVDVDGSIKSSGGYIIQVLPDTPETIIDNLEKSIFAAPPVSKMLDEGYTIEEILEKVLEGFAVKVTDKKEVKFNCDCNQHRIEGVLISLGKQEIEGIIEEQGEAEVVCHFCNVKYQFSKNHLENLLEKALEK